MKRTCLTHGGVEDDPYHGGVEDDPYHGGVEDDPYHGGVEDDPYHASDLPCGFPYHGGVPYGRSVVDRTSGSA